MLSHKHTHTHTLMPFLLDTAQYQTVGDVPDRIFDDLESRIAKLETRIEELEGRLEGAYAPGSDPAVAESLLAELGTGRDELARLYEDWEAVSLALEDDA